MAGNPLEIEVTLARDLAVGPRGGVRKAGTNVTLPATQARLLIMEGNARRANEKESATLIPTTPDGAHTALSTGTGEGE